MPPFSAPSQMTYRPDIDGLRAVAVILVVLFHAFPAIMPGGFIGVDIFFVISGYLISGVIISALEKGSFTFRHFYARRVLRIFPALTVVLCACLAEGWLALWPEEFMALGKHVLGGSTFISNILLYQETGYFDAAAHAKPLLNLWSLGIEEQFYIAFPLIVWLCWRFWRHLAIVFALLCLLSFWDNIFLHLKHPSADFYLPLSRFWELLAGAILQAAGRLFKTDNQISANNSFSHWRLMAALGGLCLLVAALFTCENDTGNYPGWLALLPVCSAMLLIGAGPQNAISRVLLANGASVFAGKISYTLYLWHWPLLSFAYILLGRPEYENAWGLRAGLLVAAFILATTTWLWVEKPIRHGNFLGNYKVPVLLCAMACMGAAGLFIYATEGYEGRIGERDMAIYKMTRRPELIDPELHKVFHPKEANLQFCRLTDTGATETVAVVGDSHAHAAYSGIAELGRERGFNTLLLGRYPAWVFEEPDKTDWTGDNILNILAPRDDIKKVFFVFRGASMLYDKPNGGDRMGVLMPAPIQAKELESHIGAFLEKLAAAGKEVVIVEDNPDLEVDVRDTLRRTATGLKIRDDYPRAMKDDAIARQKPWLEMMNRLGKIPGVTVLHGTLDAFCKGGECKVFDDAGAPLYYDDDHLSEAGSRKLAREIIAPYLAGANGKRPWGN